MLNQDTFLCLFLFYTSIENIFNYIELIGKCFINSHDLKKLIELLKPEKKFPYSINLLKCLINIAKTNNLFYNDNLFELLYHNNYDLSIINDLNFILNASNNSNYYVNNSNNKKQAKKQFYAQHFIDFSDYDSVSLKKNLENKKF